jgi:hypothetical protein
MEFETSLVNVPGVPQLLGVKLKGAVTQNRLPTHFILLVDTSGSMEIDNRLRSVKNSVDYLLNFLTPADRISVVTFSNYAENILVNQAITPENRMVLMHHISNIYASGSTNLSAGLLNVRNILQETVDDMKTGLVILTDGYANMGMTSQEQLSRIIQDMKVQHSSLSVNTIGYGLTHNGDLLQGLALQGGGSYNIVHSEENVATVFGSILGGLVSCVAQNIEITIPCDWQNFTPYNMKTEGNWSRLFIGDIYSETETVLLFRRRDAEVVSTAQIKWFSCLDMADYDMAARWSVDGAVGNQSPYRVCYIRFRISEVLRVIRKWVGAGYRDNMRDDISAQVDSIDNMINLVAGDMVGQEGVLQLLRSEIAQMREDLRAGQGDLSMSDTQFLQRSAFIATGRGVTMQLGEDFAISSPFNNATQRSITRGIHNARIVSQNDPMTVSPD